jgi:hypothetical protein
MSIQLRNCGDKDTSMTIFAPSELEMWRNLPPERLGLPSDDEISAKYAERELRIVTETNREQLPNFVAALKRPDWIRLQPFYQRRRRWDDERKSKLIESFIMNIPVPPCFLYESEFARYEVMDGQQRISAIWDFFDNKFRLKGLEQWPELNGRIYDRLPTDIRRGLDRRSISYIVLLKESTSSKDNELLLRQQVFERLNTGGVKLEKQEIRHCIYHDIFDQLLIELSRHDAMRRAFGLPIYSSEEDRNPPDSLLGNAHFSKMKDAEFVLRFFALRHVTEYRSGMQFFLDQYMVRSRRFSNEDIGILKRIFCTTIELAEALYGENLFRPWIESRESWAATPQIAFADSVMVGLSGVLEHASILIQRKAEVISATRQLVLGEPAGTFPGQRNTKEAVQHRINAFKAMLCTLIN